MILCFSLSSSSVNVPDRNSVSSSISFVEVVRFFGDGFHYISVRVITSRVNILKAILCRIFAIYIREQE